MPPTPIRFLWAFLYTASSCFHGLMPSICCILFESKNSFGVDCDLGHSKVTFSPSEQSPAISSPQGTRRLWVERWVAVRAGGRLAEPGIFQNPPVQASFQDPGWPWGGPAPNARNSPVLQAPPGICSPRHMSVPSHHSLDSVLWCSGISKLGWTWQRQVSDLTLPDGRAPGLWGCWDIGRRRVGTQRTEKNLLC